MGVGVFINSNNKNVYDKNISFKTKHIVINGHSIVLTSKNSIMFLSNDGYICFSKFTDCTNFNMCKYVLDNPKRIAKYKNNNSGHANIYPGFGGDDFVMIQYTTNNDNSTKYYVVYDTVKERILLNTVVPNTLYNKNLLLVKSREGYVFVEKSGEIVNVYDTSNFSIIINDRIDSSNEIYSICGHLFIGSDNSTTYYNFAKQNYNNPIFENNDNIKHISLLNGVIKNSYKTRHKLTPRIPYYKVVDTKIDNNYNYNHRVRIYENSVFKHSCEEDDSTYDGFFDFGAIRKKAVMNMSNGNNYEFRIFDCILSTPSYTYTTPSNNVAIQIEDVTNGSNLYYTGDNSIIFYNYSGNDSENIIKNLVNSNLVY